MLKSWSLLSGFSFHTIWDKFPHLEGFSFHTIWDKFPHLEPGSNKLCKKNIVIQYHINILDMQTNRIVLILMNIY